MKTRKKIRFKKRYWLLIDLAVVVIIIILLLHRPKSYNPPEAIYNKQVSPYLTHNLLPQLYNGAQYGEPFELIAVQDGINNAIASLKWPKESEGAKFLTPVVLFVPDSIVSIGAVSIKGMEFVFTIVVEPELCEDGLLDLPITKVKVGAMNITPLAKIIAKRMFTKKLATAKLGTESLRAKTAAALLSGELFEPVFKIDDKKVRIEKIAVTQGKLKIGFIPVFD